MEYTAGTKKSEILRWFELGLHPEAACTLRLQKIVKSKNRQIKKPTEGATKVGKESVDALSVYNSIAEILRSYCLMDSTQSNLFL